MKNVLVTGCSTGIGRCIAEGLASKGYRVFATARKQQDLEALTAAGFEVVRLDLTDTESVQQAAEQVLSRCEHNLYALINNAAYGQAGAIEDLGRDELNLQFQTNVIGTQQLTNLFLPAMRARNEGRIIQISSLLGFITMRFRGAYCASKHALESLSDAMRYELANTGIYVSLIEPGPIRSEFRNNMLKTYHESIVDKDSVHKSNYRKIEKEMDVENYTYPFMLGPEAVLARVVHALESKKPKARYFVTKPTYAFAFLKRILPGFVLDAILSRI
ncbi:MAG: SDR family NAD(P)-dependent oxidoreductase [Gammaproteobacteria bacterium]